MLEVSIMMQSLQSREQPDDMRARTIPVNPAVEDLLRQILEYVGEDATSQTQPREDIATHEVVLDVYVDGVCYTLTRSTCQPTHPRVALSPREKEIVHLVAKGLPTKAIADALNVSLWTVATHLRRTFAKLGVSSRAEMVAHAMNEGLLSARD
jgi:DNA-binding CsgD family transcriptional regulator